MLTTIFAGDHRQWTSESSSMAFTTNKLRRKMRIAKRVGLGLLGLAMLAAVIVGLTIWYLRANQVTATAIFRVAVLTPTMLADESSQSREVRTYELFKKSQLAAARSYYVLTSAVRDPNIASLPMLASIEDPIEWLEEHLETEYPEDGEYLAISLSGPESQSDDLVLIVDAVAKAYQDEVLNKEKQRQLDRRGLLADKLDQVNRNIADKFAEAFEFARSMRSGGEVLDQPGVIRLDDIDPKTLELEKQPDAPESPNSTERFDLEKQHIDQFRNQLEKIEKRVMSPGQQAVAWSACKRELVVLEQIAVELSKQLKRLNFELGMPPRIELMQPAMIDE